eukprot:2001794-Amphidinium_carterae.1
MPKPSVGLRGPSRRGDAAPKILCCYNRCRNKTTDVLNVRNGCCLSRTEADLEQCRATLRPNAQVFRLVTVKPYRFPMQMLWNLSLIGGTCDLMHKERCRLEKTAATAPRGKREPLDVQQLQELFRVLLEHGSTWVVVIIILQLATVERCGAITQAQFGWFRNLHKTAAGQPTMTIPRVNGKTIAREVVQALVT